MHVSGGPLSVLLFCILVTVEATCPTAHISPVAVHALPGSTIQISVRQADVTVTTICTQGVNVSSANLTGSGTVNVTIGSFVGYTSLQFRWTQVVGGTNCNGTAQVAVVVPATSGDVYPPCSSTVYRWDNFVSTLSTPPVTSLFFVLQSQPSADCVLDPTATFCKTFPSGCLPGALYLPFDSTISGVSSFAFRSHGTAPTGLVVTNQGAVLQQNNNRPGLSPSLYSVKFSACSGGCPSQRLTIPGHFGFRTWTFSWSWWWKGEQAPSGDPTVIDYRVTTTQGYVVYTQNGKICIQETSPAPVHCSTGDAYVNNAWKAVTLAFNGTTGTKIYIDNVFDSASVFNLETLPLPPSRDLYIHGSPDTYWAGMAYTMDDISWTNRAITPDTEAPCVL